MARVDSALANRHPWATRLGIPLLSLKPAERKYFHSVKTKLKKRLRLQSGVHIMVRGRSDLLKLRMIEDALARSAGSRELIEHSFNRRDPLEETAALAYIHDDLMLDSNLDGMKQHIRASRWIARMMSAVYGADQSTSLALFANVPARDRERIARMIRFDYSLKNVRIQSDSEMISMLFKANDDDFASYADLIVKHETSSAVRIQFLHEGGMDVLSDGAL